MIFANGLLLLLGGLLIAVPVVLHFLMQPKAKLADFPAIRFIQAQHLASKRQMRVRHWVLLALRALVILLLALALAGPAVAQAEYGKWVGVIGFGILALVCLALAIMSSMGKRTNATLNAILVAATFLCLLVAGLMGYRALQADSAGVIGDTAEPVAALILFDNSPRMSYVRENQSHFQRAQDMANWVLTQLPPGSRISVVDTQDDQPFYSVDLAAAQKRLDTFEINFLAQPLSNLLQRGIEFLQDAEEKRKEIYVLSDLTAASWNHPRDGVLVDQLSDNENISLFVIDVGTDRPVNLALGELELEADRLTENSQLILNTTLQSSDREEQRTLQLEIEKPDLTLPVIQNGKTVVPNEFWRQSQSVQFPISSGAPLRLQFGQRLPIGVHHGSLAIVGGDGLELDNRRYFTVEVRESWKVLVASGRGVNPSNLTEILAPASLVESGSAPFDVTTVTLDNLAQYDLGQFQTIYLLDPSPLTDPQWALLEKFVAQGGGLGIFLGSRAGTGGSIDPSFVTEKAQAVIGGQITTIWTRTEGDNFFSPEDLSHPIFKLLRAQQSALAWFNYPVYFHWGFQRNETDDRPTQVLLNYTDRQPAIIECLIGTGRVLTMTTPITEGALLGEIKGRPFGENRDIWNRLFAGRPLPAWLLMRQLTYYLAQLQPDTLNLETGQFARLKNDPRFAPETYALFNPKVNQPPTRITAADGELSYKFTDVPGHYRLKGSKDSNPVIKGFSANVPPAITDLKRIAPEDLDQLLGKGRYQIAAEKIEIQRQQGTSRQGKEFYPLIVTMLCVVFVLEYIMSNRFYESRQG